MNSITFGKERYHLNGEMEQWCVKTIGDGGWTYGMPGTWEGIVGLWTICSNFGNTTFCFKEDKHYHWFILRWSA